VKLFKKTKSKFYWYDFTVRGHRYRGSTQETKSVSASKVAGLKLAHVIECTDPLPNRPSALDEFSLRFFSWVDDARLENKTKKYYRNGWRLLKATEVGGATGSKLLAIVRRGLISQARLRTPRTSNRKAHASQSRGMETDQPCSENQAYERARTITQTR